MIGEGEDDGDASNAQCVKGGGLSEVAVLRKPMLGPAHWGWVGW